MHELDFKEWIYEEGFFGDIARKTKIPMLALSGVLALGAGLHQFHTPAAMPPKITVVPGEIGVTLPEKGFAFHISGYEPISVDQMHIKITAPSWKNIPVQAAIKTMGGIEGLKQRIADTLNEDPATGYDYQTPGVEFGPKRDLSGQPAVINLKNTPVDLGNGITVNITGQIRIKAKDAWIALAK